MVQIEAHIIPAKTLYLEQVMVYGVLNTCTVYCNILEEVFNHLSSGE